MEASFDLFSWKQRKRIVACLLWHCENWPFYWEIYVSMLNLHKSTLFIACLAPAMYYISHSFQDYGIAWYYLFWETWNWLKLNNASYCKPPLTWIEFENHLLHEKNISASSNNREFQNILIFQFLYLECVCVYPFIFYRFFRFLGYTTC